uniref:Uncharacterized protein n=1 Tax=Populus alba TaxID=43335 RepID=A0A4U5R181_POPAL|nr:hypothetical protein D5086_0000013430 [Populus alba]
MKEGTMERRDTTIKKFILVTLTHADRRPTAKKELVRGLDNYSTDGPWQRNHIVKVGIIFMQGAYSCKQPFVLTAHFEASSIKELGHLSMSRSGKRVKAIPPRHSASFSFSCEGGAFLTDRTRPGTNSRSSTTRLKISVENEGEPFPPGLKGMKSSSVPPWRPHIPVSSDATSNSGRAYVNPIG